jgi:phosphoribosylanthranilate isomerase
MRTRIKICGITRIDDARVAWQSGADALGLVFYPPSPRHVEIQCARDIAHARPAFVTAVGLFVDPNPDYVRQVLDAVPLDMLQFHGDEDEPFCAQFGRPFIKAVRMRAGVNLLECAERFERAQGLLVDAFVSGTHGGTGMRFDWSLIPAHVSLPVILSGGLDPANVGEAIRCVRPWAVDVSSGVEASKGIKDPARIRAFISEVYHADA